MIPVPENLSYYSYQEEDILKLKAQKATLLNAEMGCGKTIEVCGLLNTAEKIQKVLIVCPAGLKLNWKKELEKWLVSEPSISIASGSKVLEADIIIINYDILNKNLSYLKSVTWNLIVLDESQYAKNPKSKRTKACLQLNAHKRICLSGTPILNRVCELWSQLKFLEPRKWGNYIQFGKRYCAGYEQHMGNRRFWDFSGSSNIDELKRLMPVITRRKADVLDLPEKIRQIIEIDPSSEDRALINREKEYSETVQQMLLGERVDFTEISKVRHETSLSKVRHVIKHLEDCIESSGKVVCFCHHRDVLEAVAKHFERRCVKVYGGMTSSQKQLSVDMFQKNRNISLFLGNITSAGTGITLTASSHVVFAELSWVPGEMAQAEDRCHRIGQKNRVLIQHIVLSESIDAQMAKTIIRKQKLIDQMLN